MVGTGGALAGAAVTKKLPSVVAILDPRSLRHLNTSPDSKKNFKFWGVSGAAGFGAAWLVYELRHKLYEVPALRDALVWWKMNYPHNWPLFFKGKNCANVTTVEFPEYRGITINMMPFIMGDKSSIPEEYRHYWPMIQRCHDFSHGGGYYMHAGKVGYLSIWETEVEPGLSQRRPGLHVERSPPVPAHLKREPEYFLDILPGHRGYHAEPPRGNWGGIIGGIFQASSVDDTCRFWDTHVEDPGPLGSCEHLRGKLGQGQLMKAGQLWWMTDSCPHESLPVQKRTRRQWFRLVTSDVDVWYKQHSTPNPLGVTPRAIVVDGDKFEDAETDSNKQQ